MDDHRKQEKKMTRSNPDNMKKRIGMSVLGVLICGISVGMFKRADLGVDPFQSFMSGLNAVIPISFGVLYVITNVVLLSFAFIFDKRKIGLATLINLFLLGFVAEYTEKFLEKIFPSMSLAGRVILLLAAVVIMCLASAFYFTADLGVSTYDAVSLIISEKQQKVPFKFCRIISDLTAVVLGTILCLIAGFTFKQITGEVGVGTIITAFFMGPLIEFFNVHVARPFLDGKDSRKG